MQITGRLKQFLPVQTGDKKDGSGQWKKQSFLVETNEKYNNLYCFEVFGEEKVDNLTKYQKEGDEVTVEFNVVTNQHNGNYYTSLSAWKISNVLHQIQEKEKEQLTGIVADENEEEHNDLPF